MFLEKTVDRELEGPSKLTQLADHRGAVGAQETLEQD